MLPPEPSIRKIVVPSWICVTATLPVAVTLLKNPPSPRTNTPAMLPPAVIVPAADIAPNDIRLPPTALPTTLTLVKSPTEVMLPWAAVVTVPAVVADVALVAVPAVNDAAVPVNPVPAPTNAAAFTLPLADTVPVISSPVVVNTATLLVPATETLALPFAAAVTFVLPLRIAVGAAATTPVS